MSIAWDSKTRFFSNKGAEDDIKISQLSPTTKLLLRLSIGNKISKGAENKSFIDSNLTIASKLDEVTSAVDATLGKFSLRRKTNPLDKNGYKLKVRKTAQELPDINSKKTDQADYFNWLLLQNVACDSSNLLPLLSDVNLMEAIGNTSIMTYDAKFNTKRKRDVILCLYLH